MVKRRIITAVFTAIGMMMVIIDSKTALCSAKEGVALCLQVAIPSLLPFFVLSMLLTNCLAGISLPLFKSLGLLLRIPEGAESLFVLGLLGGYPSGAQNIALAWRSEYLSKDTARRMLSFCSNAGPAFFFGMVAAKFNQCWIPWLLWAIHILSAILVGILIPGKREQPYSTMNNMPISLQEALKRSVTAMANVCGWIILFRIMIAYLNKWILWLLPDELQIIISGVLELVNGCSRLEAIENVGMRFIVASGMLALGGLCVATQTVSVIDGLGIGSYVFGKLLQCGLSLALAFGVQLFFPAADQIAINGSIAAMFPLFLALFAIVLREAEKNSSIPKAFGV